MPDSEPKRISRRTVLKMAITGTGGLLAGSIINEQLSQNGTYFYSEPESNKLLAQIQSKIMVPGITDLTDEHTSILHHNNLNILIGRNNSIYLVDGNFNVAKGMIKTTDQNTKQIYVLSQRWQENYELNSPVKEAPPEEIPIIDLQYNPSNKSFVQKMYVYPISGNIAGDGNMTEYDIPTSKNEIAIPTNVDSKLPPYFISQINN